MKYLYIVLLLILFSNIYGENLTAIDYYNKAENFFNSGLYVLAFENFEKALSINPYYKEALSGLGDVYYHNNNYDSALEVYHKALDIDPAFTLVSFKLGNYYFDNLEYDSALIYFNDIIEYEPLNENALQLLAGVHIKKKNYETARALLNTLRKISPTYVQYIFRNAELLQAQNQIDKAVEEYKKLIEIEPVIEDVYFKLADIYVSQNDLSELEIVLIHAANSPDINISYRAKTYLTKLYLLQKKYKSVFSLWLKDPEDAVNNYNLGLAYKFQADSLLLEDKEAYLRRALSYFLTVLKYDSNNDFAVENIIEILLLIERVDNKARQDLSNTYYLMGNTAFNFRGKNKLAYLFYDIAKRLNPQNPDIRYNMARLFHFLNYNISAAQELNVAADLMPNVRNIRDLHHIINDILESSILTDYNYERNKIRYKITLSVTSDITDINYFDITFLLIKRLEQMLDYSDKFNIMIVPQQYKSFEQIEYFSRNFNADAIINIDLSEDNNYIKADLNFYKLTLREETRTPDLDTARRKRYLKISDFSFSRKDRNRFYELIDDINDSIIDLFPITGEIVGIDEKNDLLVNLGYRQGLKDGQELIVYSQHPDSEKNIGSIKVIKLNEWFAVCEVLDHQILHVLKLLDVVVKSE